MGSKAPPQKVHKESKQEEKMTFSALQFCESAAADIFLAQRRRDLPAEVGAKELSYNSYLFKKNHIDTIEKNYVPMWLKKI
jgi:hypothetical protein